MRSHHQKVYYVIGFLASVLFLWFSVKDVKAEELKAAFADANFWYFIPIFGSLFLFFWVKAIRWHLLLIPVERIPTKELFPSMMVGIALNHLLFGYIGELVRTYFLGKQRRLSKSTIFATIFLERIFDLLTIIFFVGVTLLYSNYLSSSVMNMGLFYTFLALGISVLLFITICVWWTDPLLRVLEKTLFWFPQESRSWLMGLIQRLVKGFHSISTPRLLMGIIITSLVQWGFMGCAHYLSIMAVGIAPPLVVTAVIIALIVFGISLPSAPAHVGLYELVYVLALKPVGVDASYAFVAAVIYHFVLSVSIIAIGMYFMKELHITFAEARKQALEVEDQA